MFGIGLIELLTISVVACLAISVPIVIIVLLVRIVSANEKKDQSPRL